MPSPRISYAPRPDTTPEDELNVLANVYSFIRQCAESRRDKEKAGVTSTGDDKKEGSKDDFLLTDILP
jgi:hypothetical protein